MILVIKRLYLYLKRHVHAVGHVSPNNSNTPYNFIICHRHGKGITKEMKRLGVLIVFGVLACTLADVQMNTGSSDVHVQWFSHLKIRADNHDIITWCREDLMLLREGTIKGGAQPSLRAVIAVIWVFQY